jgi:hypothetical protein
MRRAILGLVLVIALGGSAQATPVFYTDRNLWDQAVSARTSLSQTETFDDAFLEPWLTILSDQPGQVGGFQWQSVVDSSPVKNDTFSHSWMNVFAWGAEFNLADPGGPGEGINFYADLAGTPTLIYTMPGTAKQFLGFVLDNNDYFTYVRLEGAGGAGVQETYWMDDLSIGADVSRKRGVPDPGSSLLLLGLGLAALRAARKRSA